MKRKTTTSNTRHYDTPLVDNAFEISDEKKIKLIKDKFYDIMEILGLNMSDDSLRDTPLRVAKMYVNEIFSGLNPKNKPKITLFENKFQYDQMIVEKDITFYSNCEHHFVPFYGKTHVAYISSGHVIGLSKMNRLVQYYAKRPQIQERMTIQIGEALKEALNTDHVGVVIDARHLCVCSRGIKDTNSTTGTAFFSGDFKDKKTIKDEFLNFINS